MAPYSSCMAVAYVIAVLINGAAARQFIVGGTAGWVPPASGTMSYNDWAGKNRFLKGDTLVFKYNPSEDSVVRVSAEDYNSCSSANPITSFKDGNTAFTLPTHGPFYFISGNSSNCNNGEKLIVVVLSPRNTSPVSHTPSPAPAPSTHATPSPAPTTVATPSPAPVSAAPSHAPSTVTSPSPAPTTVVSPSPAPTTVASPTPAPTTVVSPSPAPTTVTSPTPTPSLAPPAASPSVPSMTPGEAPINSQPLNTSPSPAPTSNPSGEKPSASGPGPAVSYFAYAAVTIVTAVLSGGLYI